MEHAHDERREARSRARPARPEPQPQALRLQRAAGNRAVAGLLQRKPTITPEHVNDASIGGLSDRVPPGAELELAIGSDGAGEIVVSVVNEGDGSGAGTVDGGETKTLAEPGPVTFAATEQTGKDGNLKLKAEHGGESDTTYAFSVAALPKSWGTVFVEDLTGNDGPPVGPGFLGIKVQDTWESDSGTLGDLDEVTVKEDVTDGESSGSLEDVVSAVQEDGWPAADQPLYDSHSTPVAKVQEGVGKSLTQQTVTFSDARTGADDVQLPKSGYEIEREITAADAGGFQLKTTKRPAAVGDVEAAQGDTITRPP